jgi:hypothetical protein
MLPLVMFEIIYTIIWLIIVAYPLWAANRLAGSVRREPEDQPLAHSKNPQSQRVPESP